MQILKRWAEIIPTLIACSLIVFMALSFFAAAIILLLFAMVVFIAHIYIVYKNYDREGKSRLIIHVYIITFCLVTAIWFYRDYKENLVRQNVVEFIEEYSQMNGYHPSVQAFKAYIKEDPPYGMTFYYSPAIVDKNPERTAGYSLSYRSIFGNLFDDIYYLQKSKTWRYIPDADI
ncbi:MAG: hypothetical protein ACRCXK_14125 [Wohlfahrtiimonas sp.]